MHSTKNPTRGSALHPVTAVLMSGLLACGPATLGGYSSSGENFSDDNFSDDSPSGVNSSDDSSSDGSNDDSSNDDSSNDDSSNDDSSNDDSSNDDSSNDDSSNDGSNDGSNDDSSVDPTHVDNPYAGAVGYINPQYAEQVLEQAAATGGSLGEAMAKVADIPTAVWMDRIGAIAGSSSAMGLRDHLEAALEQRQGSTPVVITIVVYDLPNRDCAALASNGELLIEEDGASRYQTEYIGPIAELVGDPRYASLRIVAVIEPDSLPNLVTNTNLQSCAKARDTGAYVDGIQYAINSLHPIQNVYLYVDIAHSGWLGWDNNFSGAVQLYTSTVQGTDAGLESVDGFITNTANYTPTKEVYLPDSNLTVGGQQLRGASFFQGNPIFDERDFASALRNAFINAGFPSSIGILIDTSRNGWGGDRRPTGASSSTDLNTYADESRIDRRPHRGGWCNQAGAGIGERPQADPFDGVDALVWVKPPGESDGVSSEGVVDPNDPNKKFDAMCSPTANSVYDSAYPTNAMSGAPHAGRWFAEQFEMLVENAEPPL